MLALTSITGKLGNAVLTAIIDHKLLPSSQLVLCTSSDLSNPRWDTLKSQGAQLRKFDFNDPSPATFKDCTKLFLVSTPAISLDYTPPFPGRESVHKAAIDAALIAGVKHIYYTSLAFGPASKAGVMRAHLRTEEYLSKLETEGQCKVTVLREGLYNESWPLYLGYFDVGPNGDERDEVVLCGDGKVSWTSIKDLGLGTALVLSEKENVWEGRTVYLSNPPSMARSLEEVAALVSRSRGKEVKVKKVGSEEYIEYYSKMGKERAAVEWWSSSYGALEDSECAIEDRALGKLLKSRGVVPKSIEETVKEMFSRD